MRRLWLTVRARHHVAVHDRRKDRRNRKAHREYRQRTEWRDAVAVARANLNHKKYDENGHQR